ncbi:MAG: nuclear transport factor 2 family protein [Burkholderiaceae bacterium]|nr:nuclear transport factor 2 family protein [Burkholderiaceae bacterium]
MKTLPSAMDIAGFIAAAEALTQNSIEQLSAFYAEDCRFSDPFQTVQGRRRVQAVYRDMFAHLDRPRFAQVRVLGAPDHQGREVMIGWDFEFSLAKGRPRQVIHGCSRLILNAEGKIQEHIDYWDASRLMQSFPLVGPVIGWIRKKIGHDTSQ